VQRSVSREMCGLAAIFGYSSDAPPIYRDELFAIREAMITRGPDGAGFWMSSSGRVGLAHRRLSLLDLSEAGAQPMANKDGSLQIVFNGEIYNHRELRQTLEKGGFRFRSQSDTEVLLHLYADRGVEMVHALRGMYAFAIWDARKRQLFAARDPLGIKPLYYADDGNTLRIASQVKALLAGDGISNERDPAGKVGFLLLGYVPEPFTTYRAVRALPAGAYLISEIGRPPSIQSFCRIERELNSATNSNGNLLMAGHVREQIDAALRDSIARHLLADVPVGIFLSAGLDSSVMTALASESPHARLQTITLGFNEYRGTDNDETALAAMVARHYGTQHQVKWITRGDFEQELNLVVAAMDQPSIDGVNTYFVAKAAHEAGLKAALSGIGGDELFGGYPSFGQVPRMAGTLGHIVPRWLGKTLRVLSAPAIERFASPKYAGLLEYCGTYAGAYLLRRALFMPWEIDRILDAQIVREGLDALQIRQRLEETAISIGSPWLKVSALELVWYMRNQLLRDSDWAGMAHGLEIRTPLADIELLRAIAPLAAGGRLRAHKRDLANLPSKPLLRQIVERTKTGFTVPTQEWISQMTPTANTGRRGLRSWAIRLAREFNFGLSELPRSRTQEAIASDAA
jgi:asparagine synthase (glutamine-hydrolysing)